MMVPALEDAHRARMERLARMGAAPARPIAVMPEPQPAPEPAEEAPEPEDRAIIKNGMRHGPWLDIEIDAMRRLAGQGVPIKRIAVILNRSYGACVHRARQCQIVCTPHQPGQRDVLNLAEDYKAPDHRPLMSEIVETVARAHGVTVNDLLSESRSGFIVGVRHQAMWLCARETLKSLAHIGRFFNRDHTTVIHAVRRENIRRNANVRGLGQPR